MVRGRDRRSGRPGISAQAPPRPESYGTTRLRVPRAVGGEITRPTDGPTLRSAGGAGRPVSHADVPTRVDGHGDAGDEPRVVAGEPERGVRYVLDLDPGRGQERLALHDVLD